MTEAPSHVVLTPMTEQPRGPEKLAPAQDAVEGRLASVSPVQAALLARDADDGCGPEHRRLAARVCGDLDLRALREALDALVARHEALRTAFTREGDEPRALIVDPLPMQFQRIDLRRFEPPQREDALVRLAREQLHRPFDPASAPLARAALLRIDDASALLLLVVHPLAADDESLRILARDLSALYGAARAGAALEHRGPHPALAADPARLEEAFAAAIEELRGAPPVLDLPTDRGRSARAAAEGGNVPVRLAAPVAAALEELARREGAAVFDVLLAGFHALLVRHCGQSRIVVGADVPGARPAEAAAVVGPLAQLVPLPLDASDDPTFAQLVRHARDAAAGRVRATVPLDWIVDALGSDRNPSHHPLYQVAFTAAPPAALELELDAADVVRVEIDEAAPLDLRLRLFADGSGLSGSLSYRSELFDNASARRIAERLEQLLADAAARSHARVSELDVLPPHERRLVVVEWNATATLPSAYETVHELFEAKARETPDAPAVADLARELTYAELNVQANRLAHHLRRRGVGAEVVVGVAAPRSLEAVIAFLGVLKAGGAYLPLDPTYPHERLEYILAHARAQVVVTTREGAAAIPPHSAETVLVDGDTLAHEPADNPNVRVSGDCLAYVIYTSGSTGRPKGVELAHRGACNLAEALGTMFALDPSARVAFFSSLNFDASIWEMLMAIGSGACLCVVETIGRAATEIAADLRALRAAAGTFPPSFLRAANGEEIPSLRLVVSAGEQCSAELVRAWGIGRRFVNAYGPTESTVCATYATCDASLAGVPPIGKPLPNVQVYVLDPQLRSAPIGVHGELFIGGAGLARGYRSAPRLTAEAFVPDPYGPPGSRLYRTGDVTAFLPDGDMQYIGRLDSQVKLRGFRIEPGEIEAAVSRHADVREAAVVLRESPAGDPQLVAYVVLEAAARARVARFAGGAASDRLRGELGDFLQRTLPPFMLPSAYVVLDALPLSPTGKLDPMALPAVGGTDVPLDEDLTAPQTPTEEVVGRIWAENVGLARVGRHDDFLEIGGHSLVAAQVIADVRETFEIQLPVRVLFEYPVLEEFAAAVDAARAAQPATAG